MNDSTRSRPAPQPKPTPPPVHPAAQAIADARTALEALASLVKPAGDLPGQLPRQTRQVRTCIMKTLASIDNLQASLRILGVIDFLDAMDAHLGASGESEAAA